MSTLPTVAIIGAGSSAIAFAQAGGAVPGPAGVRVGEAAPA